MDQSYQSLIDQQIADGKKVEQFMQKVIDFDVWKLQELIVSIDRLREATVRLTTKITINPVPGTREYQFYHKRCPKCTCSVDNDFLQNHGDEVKCDHCGWKGIFFNLTPSGDL